MIRRLKTLSQMADPAWLAVAGLGCIAGAAWTIHAAAGWAATGVALLLLEWRLDR